MHSRVRFEGAHCTLTISRPSPGVVLIVFVGREPGELGQAPFRELEKDFAIAGQIDVFVDARDGVGTSMDVAADWAVFMRRHNDRVRSLTLLTTSLLLQLAAEAIRNFAMLGVRMRLLTEAAEFEAALAARSGEQPAT